jgi:hypothetical protein
MKSLKRAKYMIGIVAFGLLVSAVTIWPMVKELKLMVRIIGGDSAATGHLHGFLLRVIEGIEEVNAAYPFLFYGYDWLAFAHIVLAILFMGAMRDPVRNVWVVQFGLIACALIPILAGISIPLRGLPWWWFWVDFAFAPAAAIPLWVALRDIRNTSNTRT